MIYHRTFYSLYHLVKGNVSEFSEVLIYIYFSSDSFTMMNIIWLHPLIQAPILNYAPLKSWCGLSLVLIS